MTSQMNSGSNERSLSDQTESNAAKADEARPVLGGTLVNPRTRGRPKGSRNKSKAPPLSAIPETADTLKSHVFEIPNGVDVRMTLETFAHRNRRGVFILSGSGMVTNVTLLQPSAPRGIVTYTGPLGIVSLSGMFLPTTEIQEDTRITAILADWQGLITAGKVVGSMVAMDRVIVVAGIAAEIPYERLNVQPVEVQPPGVFKSPVPSAAEQHLNMMHDVCRPGGIHDAYF